MMGRKYYRIMLCLAVFVGPSAAAQANAVVGSVARNGQWGAIQFDYSGGDLLIDSWASGFTGGPTGNGIDDIALTLLVDDGSPLTAFTGTFVAFNDDRSPSFSIDGSTDSRDAMLTLPALAANSYLLAIGHAPNRFLGDITSGSGIPSLSPDFKITFSLDVLITGIDGISTLQAQTPVTAVPEPGVLALLGFGFLGIGFSLRRRRQD